jgi:GcrA cell cycle regulator
MMGTQHLGTICGLSEAGMEWTEQRIEMLRRLWGQGQTASQIASALGGVTRNAVIGKAHRLGVMVAQAKSMMPLQRSLQQPQSSAPEAVPSAPREPVRNYPPARAHGGTKSCSWPMGDPKQAGFHFCGEPSEPGRPYCASHCHQAYQRKSEAA